jgi:hypothetical protein
VLSRSSIWSHISSRLPVSIIWQQPQWLPILVTCGSHAILLGWNCYTVTTYNLVAQQQRITSKCIHCVLRQCNPSGGLNDADALVDATLANAMHAMRASFHSGLRTTPWSIRFSIAIATWLWTSPWCLTGHGQFSGWLTIAWSETIASDSPDYQPNQKVLKLQYKPDKLTPRATGPYWITSVHTNGTITIQLTPHTRQRISICNAKLFVQ